MGDMSAYNNAVAIFDENGNMCTKIAGYEVFAGVPVDQGGTGEYPTPGAFLISALAACALGSIHIFCQQRNISSKGAKIEFKGDINAKDMTYNEITYHVTLPDDFPDKYINSVKSIIHSCPVGKSIDNMPERKIVIEQ